MPYKYHKLPTLTEQDKHRIWRQIDKTPGQGPQGECWQWTGYTISRYGHLCLRATSYRVTRLVYLETRSEDPGDFHILHKCDNPPCCRPDHLFKGTQAENLADMTAKGRGDFIRCPPERRARGKRHGSQTHPESRPVGEKVWNSKLTVEQVLEIRALRGLRTHQSIADQYGVGRVAITDIMSGRNWKHI